MDTTNLLAFVVGLIAGGGLGAVIVASRNFDRRFAVRAPTGDRPDDAVQAR